VHPENNKKPMGRAGDKTLVFATVEPFLPCPPLCMTISDFNITNKIARMVPLTMTMFRGISVFGI
jgi:hypothetical protein